MISVNVLGSIKGKFILSMLYIKHVVSYISYIYD